MRRPDKDYFKHDLLDIEDDRLGELIAEFGAEGYAVFYRIITLLHQRHGDPLESFAFKGVARSLKITEAKVQEIVRYAFTECNHLFEVEEDKVYSNRVIQDIRELEEERERIRQVRAEAGRAGGLKSAEARRSKCQANASNIQAIASKNEANVKQMLRIFKQLLLKMKQMSSKMKQTEAKPS